MCHTRRMQGFSKRRRKPGPSKNEEKVRRQEDADRRGSIPLSAAYPRLEHLSGELSFAMAVGGVLETKRIQADRNQNVKLSFDCPGRCGSGQFHLGPKVSAAVAQGRERLDIAESCNERTMGVEPCGCKLTGTLTLRLTPPPAPAA